MSFKTMLKNSWKDLKNKDSMCNASIQIFTQQRIFLKTITHRLITEQVSLVELRSIREDEYFLRNGTNEDRFFLL